MRETLYDANGQDETRIKRAFGWVVTFRDFPAGCHQTVDGDSMMTEALTLFTKGRAEFYLDGVRRGDRVPGILSSEHDLVGEGGTFTLKYVEPTTRVCIPARINRNRLPIVSKHLLEPGQSLAVDGKYLVAFGTVTINAKQFEEERCFKTTDSTIAMAIDSVILLQFHD